MSRGILPRHRASEVVLMARNTREKMVLGAADLLKRRGLNATSLREVVRHTSTPRGSISHHFPRGKQQLIEEAVRHAGQEVSVPLQAALERYGVRIGMRCFIAGWRQMLEATDYEAGCPVLAVALEEYIGEDAAPSRDVQQQLLDQVRDVFDDWQGALRRALLKEGHDEAGARRLATLIVAAVEGSVALCRAERSARPLDDVGSLIEQLLPALP